MGLGGSGEVPHPEGGSSPEGGSPSRGGGTTTEKTRVHIRPPGFQPRAASKYGYKEKRFTKPPSKRISVRRNRATQGRIVRHDEVASVRNCRLHSRLAQNLGDHVALWFQFFRESGEVAILLT